MASTTDLGKWMLTNGGEYNPETAYEQLTMVMYENSTYITLKTVQGVTPTDDHVNYQLMAKGFDPTALASVQAEDTSGVLGEAGSTVSAQELVDWVVDQAANKLLKLTDLVSVQTNDATKGVSAALAYAMNQKIEQTNSNLDGKVSTSLFYRIGLGNTYEMVTDASAKWILAYELGSTGLNGKFDIFLIRTGYDKTTKVTKMTSITDLTCTATIVNDKLHIVWTGPYVHAVFISA